jgi:hypothetical protein
MCTLVSIIVNSWCQKFHITTVEFLYWRCSQLLFSKCVSVISVCKLLSFLESPTRNNHRGQDLKEYGDQDHKCPSCSLKRLDNTWLLWCSSWISKTESAACDQAPSCWKKFSEIDTHSLEKWKIFFLKDLKIKITSHSIIKKLYQHYHFFTQHTAPFSACFPKASFCNLLF